MCRNSIKQKTKPKHHEKHFLSGVFRLQHVTCQEPCSGASTPAPPHSQGSGHYRWLCRDSPRCPPFPALRPRERGPPVKMAASGGAQPGEPELGPSRRHKNRTPCPRRGVQAAARGLATAAGACGDARVTERQTTRAGRSGQRGTGRREVSVLRGAEPRFPWRRPPCVPPPAGLQPELQNAGPGRKSRASVHRVVARPALPPPRRGAVRAPLPRQTAGAGRRPELPVQ